MEKVKQAAAAMLNFRAGASGNFSATKYFSFDCFKVAVPTQTNVLFENKQELLNTLKKLNSNNLTDHGHKLVDTKLLTAGVGDDEKFYVIFYQ